MSFVTLKRLSNSVRHEWSLLVISVVVVLQGLFAFLIGILLFYRSGIYFLDAGYYVYTLASQNFGRQPPAIGSHTGTSLFDTHMLITPLIVSQIFRVVTSAPINFIMFLGLQHLVIAIAGSLLMAVAFLQNNLKKSQAWFSAILGAVLVPFSNIGLGSLLYPHVEVFGTSLVAIGVLLLVLRWTYTTSIWLLISAWVAILLGLLTRQDIGLHLAITLISAFVCSRWKTVERAAAKKLALLLTIGLLSSFFLMGYQRLFAGEHDVFTVSYSGSPPYAHITSIWYIINRSFYLLASRLDLIIGLCAFIIAALVFRKREYLAFPLAVMPWLLLNMTAIDPAKNSMGIYHLFPIILYATAPILALTLSPKNEPPEKPDDYYRTVPYATYGIAIVSLFLGGISAAPTGFGYVFTNVLRLPLISASEISATHEAIKDFVVANPKIAVDNAVMSIRPVLLKDVPLLPTIQNPSQIDSILFFARYVVDRESEHEIFKSWIEDNRLITLKCLPGGLVQANASYSGTITSTQTDTEIMARAQACHPQPGL